MDIAVVSRVAPDERLAVALSTKDEALLVLDIKKARFNSRLFVIFWFLEDQNLYLAPICAL